MGGEASRNVITQHDSDHRRHLEKELGAGGLKAALEHYSGGFGSQGATPEVSPLHPELAPVSDACETAQRPTQPGKQELREFCRQVEAAVARKQAMADAPYEEPSTWVNYVGGSLNTRSRVHKPHHTIQTTPYLSQSVVTSYIKGGGAASLAAAANASVPFKRRNSTGSLEVRLTVDNMDVAGMVRVIALILHHHILQGSALDWPIAKQFAIFDDSVMSFRACRNGEMPTFEQVHDFFSYIYRTAQLECDCVVTSLFYIERLLMETAGELRMCRTNWRSITLSGMILASKVWDDLSMWSVDFARVGRLTLKRINELEVAVLQALQYNVRVDSSNFARYFFRLRNWCLLLNAAASAAASARNKAIAISTAGGDDAHKRRRSYTDSMVPPPPPVRTRSLPGRCMPPPLQIQRKTTLSSSQFESIYKGLSPCLEELVEGPQTDAGGSRECCRDLKEHERRASIGYCLRKRQKKAIIQNLILSEVRDVCAVYDVEPMRLLGVGISGVVQIVRHRGTGVEYAMKTLRLDRLRDFRKMGELRNEIEVMSTLNHPNIVRLLEIYESPARDTVSLIMELCTGGELLTRLNANGRYSEALCADLARKMLSAVRHCHDHSICHRDLKLENWVFEDSSPTAELKLIDFGLSRHFGENEVMHVPVGTPYSVAPEVLSGSYTCACDLWSLGVLVFMLLTGNAPFAGADDFAVLEAVKAGVWSWPADMRVSAGAKSFVEHLLVLDPAKRMTAVQALKHPWIAQVVSPRATVVAPSPNVLESLRQFEHMSAVKRLVLQMVAFSMEPWQVDALRQEFQIIDTDCNGLISLDDMRYALERSGAVADNNELRALLDAVAMDHSGNIRYNDFLAAGLMSLGPATVLDERNLRAVFDKFDRRKEGWISAEAFSDFLGKQITADEISEVLTEAGVAANWRIDFQGFVHIMRSATASPKTPCSLHADPVDAAITAAYAEAFPSM